MRLQHLRWLKNSIFGQLFVDFLKKGVKKLFELRHDQKNMSDNLSARYVQYRNLTGLEIIIMVIGFRPATEIFSSEISEGSK